MFFKEDKGRRRAPDDIPEGCETHMEEPETKDIAFKHITSVLDDVAIGSSAPAREEAESELCYVQNN